MSADDCPCSFDVSIFEPLFVIWRSEPTLIEED